MMMTKNWTPCAIAFALLMTPAFAGSILTVDFETEDDFSTPLVNGQIVDAAFDAADPEFGNIFNLSTTQGSNGHIGATIFDSSNPGPNTSQGDPDTDLLVNLGNILILQDNQRPTTSVGPNGLQYDEPDDEAATNAGSILFDFFNPVRMESVTIVDANGGFGMEVILTDGTSLTRVYTIPSKWTKDIAVAGPNGFQDLDLTTLANQPAEPGAGGGDATAVEDAGFDPLGVVSIEFVLTGTGTTSGGIDNLRFEVPEPSSLLLASMALVGVFARRRSL